MRRGFIKLWRENADSGMFQNPQLWTFWCWCLFKASDKSRIELVGFQEVELEPGQFIFGRKSAASDLKMSEQTIRTCLKKLEKSEKITIKPTRKFSVITIVNWDTYQAESYQANHQTNQQLTTNKNSKNSKKENVHPDYPAFLEGFNRITGYSYRGDTKSKRQFNARIRDYALEEILKAVEAAAGDKYLMGENDNGRVYLSPEFITRPDKLEKWLNNKAKQKNQQPSVPLIRVPDSGRLRVFKNGDERILQIKNKRIELDTGELIAEGNIRKMILAGRAELIAEAE